MTDSVISQALDLLPTGTVSPAVSAVSDVINPSQLAMPPAYLSPAMLLSTTFKTEDDQDNEDDGDMSASPASSDNTPSRPSRPPPRKKAKTAEEKEIRAQERILRNRQAAQASRERKRKHMEELEVTNEKLEAENARLHKRVKAAEEESAEHKRRLDEMAAQLAAIQSSLSAINAARPITPTTPGNLLEQGNTIIPAFHPSPIRVDVPLVSKAVSTESTVAHPARMSYRQQCLLTMSELYCRQASTFLISTLLNYTTFLLFLCQNSPLLRTIMTASSSTPFSTQTIVHIIRLATLSLTLRMARRLQPATTRRSSEATLVNELGLGLGVRQNWRLGSSRNGVGRKEWIGKEYEYETDPP
ncbi:hypothetical protein SAICODRAFT_69050 [Saitoella complicata NRRL Y-17804]|nr:uncharacterized protein SAICODRAFT_69050 [Saitoella complicata NRRL Y-17804]ODQ55713.1 hypothetical protein SAICODRAFT_69050 [Saitoella complicata NRRL Y-17804]